MRRFRFLLPALAAALAAAAAAQAAGPSPGVSLGSGGVASPDGTVRYVALPAGAQTVTAAIRTRDGSVLRSGSAAGAFGVPLVTFDGTTGGLSRDGALLVLGQPLGPRTLRGTSRFLLVGTRRLLPKRTLELRGDFAFDALSPDARTLYLIQHTDSQDVLRYVVRAYDLRTDRLLPGAITDARQPDEEMKGVPWRRAASADGRWIYTLYRGDGKTFVHALDSVRSSAVCVDLPWNGEGDARLELTRDHLLVRRATGATLAAIDTATLKVVG